MGQRGEGPTEDAHVEFEQVLEKHRTRLRRMIALRMDDRLLSRFDASDVVQDSFVAACRQQLEIQQSPAKSLYAWLREIARNCLTDLYRRHVCAQRRSVVREESMEGPTVTTGSLRSLPDRQPSADQMLDRRELRMELERALASLSPLDRRILELRHFDHRSIEEIADLVGLTSGAVRARHVRSLTKLQALVRVERGPALGEFLS